MTTHSSILAWRIPWTEEPGGLQSQSQTRLKQLSTQASSQMRRRILAEDYPEPLVVTKQELMKKIFSIKT